MKIRNSGRVAVILDPAVISGQHQNSITDGVETQSTRLAPIDWSLRMRHDASVDLPLTSDQAEELGRKAVKFYRMSQAGRNLGVAMLVLSLSIRLIPDTAVSWVTSTLASQITGYGLALMMIAFAGMSLPQHRQYPKLNRRGMVIVDGLLEANAREWVANNSAGVSYSHSRRVSTSWIMAISFVLMAAALIIVMYAY